MKSNYEIVMDACPNIVGMLKDISRELWYIFLPARADNLHQLELQIIEQKLKDGQRDQVMAIQNLCGLPLRPNELLQETQAKARLQGKRKDKQFRKQKKKRGDSDDNPSGYHNA